MFCYVAALKIHSHGKANYSLPEDKERKEKWFQEQMTLIYSVPKH